MKNLKLYNIEDLKKIIDATMEAGEIESRKVSKEKPSLAGEVEVFVGGYKTGLMSLLGLLIELENENVLNGEKIGSRPNLDFNEDDFDIENF